MCKATLYLSQYNIDNISRRSPVIDETDMATDGASLSSSIRRVCEKAAAAEKMISYAILQYVRLHSVQIFSSEILGASKVHGEGASIYAIHQIFGFLDPLLLVRISYPFIL